MEEWSSLDEEGGDEDDDGSTPEELRDFLASLPRNLHLDKVRSQDAAAAAGREEKGGIGDDGGGGGIPGGRGREPIPAIVEEDENDDEENDDDDDDDDDDDGGDGGEEEGLINAWQYRRSIQDARRGIGAGGGGGGGGGGGATGRGTYCHSYDLSGRMSDQFPPSSSGAANTPLDNARIVDCSPTAAAATTTTTAADGGRRARGLDLFRRLWSRLVSTSRSRPNTVIRLFLHRLPVGAGSIALPLLMSKVRREDLPVVVLVTIRPWRWLSHPPSSRCDGEYDAVCKLDALSSLRRTADVALSLDSFSSLRAPPPPEFSLLRGILSVRRCAPQAASSYADASVSKRPLADRFGVKRDGRKITLQLLHLPPEGHGAGGRGSGGGGVRSVGVASVVADDEDSRRPRGDGIAGRSSAGGCSSLGGGGTSLDF